MKKDLLSIFLEKNKDILYLRNKNNTLIAGPEYCLFKSNFKEELIKFFKISYPEISFIELNLPCSVESLELQEEGYSKNFELLSVRDTSKSLRPQLFATTYRELPTLKHYFGSKTCYYSLGSSFRNQKSTKRKVIRSFEFQQLELQFVKIEEITVREIFDHYLTFLSNFSHNSNNLKLEVKKNSELPFYSTCTYDMNYVIDLNSSLELCSISEREEGQIIELSTGITRCFITCMLDSSIKRTKASNSLILLNTKFTKKILDY